VRAAFSGVRANTPLISVFHEQKIQITKRTGKNRESARAPRARIRVDIPRGESSAARYFSVSKKIFSLAAQETRELGTRESRKFRRFEKNTATLPSRGTKQSIGSEMKTTAER